jgi:hypothetical protein
MASTLYGAVQVQNSTKDSNLRYDIVGKNSELFHSGELVTETSGVLLVAATTDPVYGVVVKTQAMASDNQTVAQVKPGYIPANEGIFLMGADADLSVVASNGLYFPVTGATATQQISVATLGGTTGATGVSRVLQIVKVDPFNEGGTGAGSGLRQAFVRIVKTPYTNVAITA